MLPVRRPYAIKLSFRAITAVFSSLCLFVTQTTAYALPQGGQVGGGSAGISSSGGRMDIDQSSSRAIFDWGSFNIGSGETVNFNQPGSSAVALNRIHDANPSQIDGVLNANGQVWLVNSQGIAFGSGAQVNVGGLLATSSDIDNNRFMSGDYTFDKPGNPSATIANAGHIHIADGALAALVGPNVTNSGQIEAKLGRVQLASGDTFALDLYGDGLINLQASDAMTRQLVGNSGTIDADGGSVTLTAATAENAINSLVNLGGGIAAHDVVIDSGSNGTTLVSGSIDARSDTAGEKGGTVDVLGKNVGILSGAAIDASGKAGGGVIRIGGDAHGAGATRTAARTIVQDSTNLYSNATDNGDGGKVVVWADGRTDFAGNIEAKGGVNGGNGGFVETSGKQFLNAVGNVDASAPFGNPGLWLLDPNNVTIQAAGSDTNVTGSPNFTTTNDSAIVTTGSIETALNAGTSVSVTTGSAGTNAQAGDITVASSVSKTAGGDATLTLSAANDIAVNNGVSISSNTGKLNVVLDSDADASGAGAIVMNTGSSITSNGGNITLGGGADPTTGFAYGNATYGSGIRLFAASLTSGSGNILMHGESYQDPGLTYANNGISISSGSITATGSGSITMYGQRASSGAVGTVDGIRLSTPNISVVNGNLALYGNYGTVGQTSYMGIQSTGGTISSSGNGTVTLWGENGSQGFYTNSGSINSVNGDINITGSGTGRSVDVQYSSINSTGTGAGAAKINITGTGGTMTNWQPGGINTVDGNVTITSAQDFNMPNDFDITATGSAAVTIKAKNDIVYSGSGDITTNGGAVTLNSDSDASGAGAIYLGSGTNIATSGGNITLGGGANPLTDYARGDAAHTDGVAVNGATINAGGGNITANGQAYIGNYLGYSGVSLTSTAMSATGTGTITLNGHTASSNSGGDNGVLVNNSTVTVQNGAMAMNATETSTSNEQKIGINIAGTSTLQSTGTGAITLIGDMHSDNAGSNQYNIGIKTSGASAITSAYGDITLTGHGSDKYTHGLKLYGTISSTGSGAGAAQINLNGSSTGISDLDSYGIDLNGTVSSVDGNISLTGSAPAVSSNGSAPILLDTSSAITVTGNAGVSFTGGTALAAATTVSANTGNVSFSSTINSFDTTPRDLTVTSTGGTITLGGALGATYALNNVTLTSSGAMVLPAVTATSLTARTTGATADMTLNGTITASGAGNAIILSTPRNFINNAGATPLVLTGGGRFIGYSNKQIDDTNPISATQQITGFTYNTLAPGSIVPATYNGTQNTWVYNLASGTITIVAANKSMTYGGVAPAFTYSFACSDGCSSSVMSGALATDATTSGSGGYNAGTWSILQGSLATSNGYTINFTPGTFTVNPAALLVAADIGQTKIYGTANPGAYTYGASGFVNGDTSAVLTGALSRAAGENVGNYAINQGTLSAGGNYTISYTSHTFSITPATLNVTADAGQSKIYGAANPTYTYGYSGLTNGDTASVFTGSQTRAAGENVGNYAIAQGTLSAGGNYTINYTGNNFAINPATLTVTANARSKTYGAADPALTYGYSGLVNGDTSAVFTGIQNRVAGENVGAYVIAQGTLSAGSNYTISYTGNTLTINPATLTVTANALSKSYGQADPTLSYSLSGLKSGDTAAIMSGAQVRVAGENVGTYAITQGTLAASSNYTIAYTGANFVINQAQLAVSADPKHKEIGDPDPALTYTFGTLYNGDTAASVFTGVLARVAGENVGTYAITQGTLAASANYHIVYTPGLFTVGNYVPPAITSGIPSVVNGYIHESNSVFEILRRVTDDTSANKQPDPFKYVTSSKDPSLLSDSTPSLVIYELNNAAAVSLSSEPEPNQ